MKGMRWYAVLVLLVAVLCAGCATPSEKYVRADAAAWAQYDKAGRLDTWIAEAVKRGELTQAQADDLGKLNDGRRARIRHALAQFKKE